LPELVGPEHGFLSAKQAELVSSIQEHSFDMRACHQHAVEHFNAETMAHGYLEKYEQVLAGERLSKNHPRANRRDVRLPWN
jgi:hypothetical protein